MLPVRDDIEDIPGVRAGDNGGGYLLSWCFGCTQGEHAGRTVSSIGKKREGVVEYRGEDSIILVSRHGIMGVSHTSCFRRKGYMQAITSRVPAAQLADIIQLPPSFLNGDVNITVEPVCDTDDVVESLWGCASNLDMTAEDVRRERLASHAASN